MRSLRYVRVLLKNMRGLIGTARNAVQAIIGGACVMPDLGDPYMRSVPAVVWVKTFCLSQPSGQHALRSVAACRQATGRPPATASRIKPCKLRQRRTSLHRQRSPRCLRRASSRSRLSPRLQVATVLQRRRSSRLATAPPRAHRRRSSRVRSLRTRRSQQATGLLRERMGARALQGTAKRHRCHMQARLPWADRRLRQVMAQPRRTRAPVYYQLGPAERPGCSNLQGLATACLRREPPLLATARSNGLRRRVPRSAAAAGISHIERQAGNATAERMVVLGGRIGGGNAMKRKTAEGYAARPSLCGLYSTAWLALLVAGEAHRARVAMPLRGLCLACCGWRGPPCR